MRTLLTLALLAASLPAVSQSGGTFNYGLTLDAGERVTILQNQTIELTGLSGVTGAAGQGFFYLPGRLDADNGNVHPSPLQFGQCRWSRHRYNPSGRLVGDDDRAGGPRD